MQAEQQPECVVLHVFLGKASPCVDGESEHPQARFEPRDPGFPSLTKKPEVCLFVEISSGIYHPFWEFHMPLAMILSCEFGPKSHQLTQLP